MEALLRDGLEVVVQVGAVLGSALRFWVWVSAELELPCEGARGLARAVVVGVGGRSVPLIRTSFIQGWGQGLPRPVCWPGLDRRV